MTPTLKAMVEAMAAELTRQACDDDGAQSFTAAGELTDSKMGFDGDGDAAELGHQLAAGAGSQK